MEEISDMKRDFNIDKMCRTCLQETEDEMHEIFGSIQQEQSGDALTLNQVLLQLTGNIQVTKDNNRMSSLCFEEPSKYRQFERSNRMIFDPSTSGSAERRPARENLQGMYGEGLRVL